MSVEVKPLLRLFLKTKTHKGQAFFVARIVSHLIFSVFKVIVRTAQVL